MTSKRAREGYLMIDSRCSPGMPADLVHAAKLPAGACAGLFEAPTCTCSHCQAVVVLNPNRTRERAYCTGCDSYLCDLCGAARAAAGGLCKTFAQVIEEIQEAASRQTIAT